MKKVDNGFELSYWNLSYRGKLIRTIWMLPFALIIPLYFHFREIPTSINSVVSILLFLVWIFQILHNYRKYQHEKNRN